MEWHRGCYAVGMKKSLILLASIFLISTSYSAESFRLLLDNAHSEELIEYLEEAGIQVERANPFAQIETSESVAKHLGEFAHMQHQQIVQARESYWNEAAAGTADEKKYLKNYYKLRDAKIRHRLALQALEHCTPEIAAVGLSNQEEAN